MLFKKIIAVVLAISLLTSGYFLVNQLNNYRQSMELTRANLSVQANPDLLTNVLLSVGRALAVDYLWIGLQKMQEEGRYFDAMQRAEWICQLQPHFPSVWVFQSWNMAYNISVAMTSGEDRWRWVRNGYELLRDRAIPLNPKSIVLYYQLSWIFFHKIGALSDDYHWYYKIQLARAMEKIIGWPDAKYDLMAKAPRDWETLLKDKQIAEFVNRLEAMKINPRNEFLGILKNRENVGEKVLALIDNAANKKVVEALEGFIRADELRKEWKMDPKIIADLRKPSMYGPLDFRLPQSHAIYWAYVGLKRSGRDVSFDALNALTKKGDTFNALNCKRVIYGSLQDIFKRGRFIITSDGIPLISPDIRFIPILHRVYLALGRNYAQAEGKKWDGTAGETFRSGHVNFLRKAIAMYYQYGRTDMARKYWKILNKLYPNKEYKIGMQAYIYKYIREDLQSMGLADANSTVMMFLMQAYTRYALGDDYEAAALKKWAKMVYDAYMKDKLLRQQTGRTALASWDKMNRQAIKFVLKSISPKLADRLRERLNISVKQKRRHSESRNKK